jgi:hypothetical protein
MNVDVNDVDVSDDVGDNETSHVNGDDVRDVIHIKQLLCNHDQIERLRFTKATT